MGKTIIGSNCNLWIRFACAHAAASRGHLEILRFLFETANINLTVKTKAGKTTINLAAEKGHDYVVLFNIHSSHCAK